jgi:hypothetical protein
MDKAYLRRLYRATDNIEKGGGVKFRYTLGVEVILAAVHLRVNLGQKDCNPVRLHKLVVAWQNDHGETSASDKDQWEKVLKDPEIIRLLSLLRS